MSRPKHAERVYGWWNFDESKMTLFQAGSTSRLRFLGLAENDSELDLTRSNVRQWFRFDAELEGFTYPLLVEVRYCRRPDGDRVPVWRLDHSRSATLAARAGVVDAHPDHALWIRLDHFAIDALLCWPETEATGWKVQPGLAVNGGWRSGEWRSDLYRYYRGANTENEFHISEPPIPRPNPQLQPHWSFVGASQAITGEEAVRQLEALRAAEPSEVLKLIDDIAKSRPHLRGGDRLLMPLAAGSSYPRQFWLYVDEDVVTDRIRVQPLSFPGFEPSWNLSLDGGAAPVGTIDRQSGARAAHIRTSEGIMPRDRVSPDLLLRLFELTEGILAAWKTCEVELPDMTGGHARHTVPAPAFCWTLNAHHYGGRSSTGATVALSLDRASRLRPMFDDSSPYATQTLRPSGWMQYDAASRSMVNIDTGQALRFERTLEGSPLYTSGQVSRFLYEDSHIRMPVIIHRRAVRPLHGERQIDRCWRINYAAAEGSLPPFDTWTRSSAHVFDAVMLWPETDYAGPALGGALAVGGWLNGQWEPNLRRSGTIWSDGSQATVEHPGTIVTAETVSRWTVVGDPGQPVKGITPIDIDPENDFLVDPISVAELVDGGHGVRAFQVREDRSAVLFVCGTRIEYGPDGWKSEVPVYEYCDSDVRVRCTSSSRNIALYPLLAPRLVRSSPFAQAGGDQIQLYVVGGGNVVRPGPELYRRLVDALTGPLVLRSANRVTEISGRYTAGVWQPHATQSVWIESANG